MMWAYFNSQKHFDTMSYRSSLLTWKLFTHKATTAKWNKSLFFPLQVSLGLCSNCSICNKKDFNRNWIFVYEFITYQHCKATFHFEYMVSNFSYAFPGPSFLDKMLEFFLIIYLLAFNLCDDIRNRNCSCELFCFVESTFWQRCRYNLTVSIFICILH